MCDTFIALPIITRTGNVLLAKNSDREPDEAQAIQHIRRQHQSAPTLRCTFIDVPPVKESYECILSKPFQMWGAEMGVNEWGLAIGNEAVFTKVKFNKRNPGLTGMDLLRLALERCKTAMEAIDCITRLLETYGQDACGGYKDKSFYYHNSFLIADTQAAWVLETAGKEWAVQQVHGSRSISNRLTIVEADRLSSTAQLTAKIKGWWDGQSPFNFREAYTDWLYTRVGRAAVREACTLNLVNDKAGQLCPGDCMEILQTHNVEDHLFKPRKATTGSVCMHATGLLNPSQTTGSMVTELRKDQPHTVWLTGTSMPCLSVYIPFYFGTSALDNLLQPTAQFDPSLWWRAERLHRWICKDYMSRKSSFESERLALQQSFLQQDEELLRKGCSMEDLDKFSATCLMRTEQALVGWSNNMKD